MKFVRFSREEKWRMKSVIIVLISIESYLFQRQAYLSEDMQGQ